MFSQARTSFWLFFWLHRISVICSLRIFAVQVSRLQVPAACIGDLQKTVDERFEVFCSAIPSSVLGPSRSAIRHSWLRQNYVDVVADIVQRSQSHAQSIKTATAFAPEIDPGNLPAEQATEALAAFARVTPELHSVIVEGVDAAWSAFQADMKPATPEDTVALRSMWLRAQYVNIVKSVLKVHTQKSEPASTAPSAALAEKRGSAVVQSSPRKVLRRGAASSNASGVVSQSQLQQLSAPQIHAGSPEGQARLYKFTGQVVSAEDAVRNISVTNRRTQEATNRSIFEITLDDGLCPVTLCAWGSKAELLSDVVSDLEARQEADPDASLALEVQVFNISAMKDAAMSVCPLHTITTIDASGKSSGSQVPKSDEIDLLDGTRFSIVPFISRGALASPQNRTPAMVGLTLEKLKDVPIPCRVVVTGVVCDVSSPQPTLSSGKLCRTVRITDGKGGYLDIRQLGSDAESIEVKKNTRVLCYFLSIQKGTKSDSKPTAWAFENAIVKAVGSQLGVPVANREIVPGSKVSA